MKVVSVPAQFGRLLRDLLCVSLLVCPCGLAQVTGSISGYVRDPTSAAIPGASVTATLVDQKTVRTAQSDTSGFYNFLSMPRGTYSVTVEVRGFTTKTAENIQLTAGENARADFDLTVGSVGERVTVQATTPLVETTNATQSNLIDDRRVQDLPLNGRNVVGLANVMASVVNVSATQTMADSRLGPSMSVNGSNINANYYTLNGATYTNFDQTTGLNPPPPDAIQEIRIQTHDFPAEYGFTSGSQVSMVSKSGTNEFHGTAWEFFRNNVLNARSFFQPYRPRQVQNQMGVAGGGPIRKDKVFAFGSYQRLWQRQDTGSTLTVVPTAAQRTGNFTGLPTTLRNPTNPLTGAPYTDSTGRPCVANNIIAAGCISPASQSILQQFIPASSGNSVVTITPNPWDNANWLGRVDFNISPKNQLFTHFVYDHTNTTNYPGNLVYIPQTIYTNVAQAAIHDTYTFSPTLINEGVFSYTYNKSKGGPDATIPPSSLGVNLPLDPNGRGLSTSISGGANLSYPGITYEYYSSFQFDDGMTWIHGPHTVKLGYDLIQMRFWFLLALTRSITFTGTRTGNATADFMLGAFDNASIEYGAADHTPAGWKHALFVEDSYKVNSRLTLNYGVRYEPFLPFNQVSGRNLTWIAGQTSTVRPDSPPGILFPGDPQIPNSLVNSDLNNFAPRLGFAWDVKGDAKTVVRGAYGMFFQDPSGDITHSVEAPWRGSIQLFQGQLADPFGSLNKPQPPTNAVLPGRFGCSKVSTYPGLSCSFALPVRIAYTDPNLRTPYVQHVNFSVQRQFGRDWVLEGSYIGQIGIKLLGHNFFNPGRTINSPLTGLPPTPQNVEERTPTESSIISAQSRVLGNFYRSWYHGLDVKLTKRLSNGLTVQADYMLSKNITNQTETTVGLISTVPNPFNLRAGQGPALLDHRHVVAVSWVWTPGVKFSNPFLKNTIGGWTFTGLHRYQTGGPLFFVMGTDQAANGTLNAATSQLAQLAPGITAANLSVQHANRAAEVAQYFNTAAFVRPSQLPYGIYGNAGRGIAYGPSYFDTDLSVLRYIPLFSERVRAQLRGEFFNTFNQVNFNNPDANASSGTFGRILSAQPGRVIQLAVKIAW